MATYFRTARGGQVPLDEAQRKELLGLYTDLERPVREIATLYGVSDGTIYRWLDRLGVRPWPSPTRDPYATQRGTMRRNAHSRVKV